MQAEKARDGIAQHIYILLSSTTEESRKPSTKKVLHFLEYKKHLYIRCTRIFKAFYEKYFLYLHILLVYVISKRLYYHQTEVHANTENYMYHGSSGVVTDSATDHKGCKTLIVHWVTLHIQVKEGDGDVLPPGHSDGPRHILGAHVALRVQWGHNLTFGSVQFTAKHCRKGKTYLLSHESSVPVIVCFT